MRNLRIAFLLGATAIAAPTSHTNAPSPDPTADPSTVPTINPTATPSSSISPSFTPSPSPSFPPSSTYHPTSTLSSTPSFVTQPPTNEYTEKPSIDFTTAPSADPNAEPSNVPTITPSSTPSTTTSSSISPSITLSSSPSFLPSFTSGYPSSNPNSVATCSCPSCINTSSGFSDPHFTTWNYQYYDFQGGCDLIAIDNPILQLQIRTRPTLWSWSAIRQVALVMKINGSITASSPYLRLETGQAIPEYNSIPTTVIVPDYSQQAQDLYYFRFANNPNVNFIRIEKWGAGAFNVEVQGDGSIFCDSEGMFGSWEYGGVRDRSLQNVPLPEPYFHHQSILDLAQSWKIVNDSKLRLPSIICNSDPLCGPTHAFACGVTERRDRSLGGSTCGLTCDDITDPLLKNFCEMDITLTGDPSWACQSVYTAPVISKPSDLCAFVKEEGTDEFLKSPIKKKPRIWTCDRLTKKKKKTIKKICRRDVDYYIDGNGTLYAPPQVGCPITCKACDPCRENKRTKYTHAVLKKGPVYKRCNYLKNAKNKKKICKRKKSVGGYPAPASACPQTCGTIGCN